MSELKELIQKIKKFRDDRDWMQFHNHKDMALSLVLEAAEVLEHFQWKTGEQVSNLSDEKKQEIGEELADVMIYALELIDNLGLDAVDICNKKIEKNDKKYPADKAKGSAKKYTDL